MLLSLCSRSFRCAGAQGQPVLVFGQHGKVFQPTYRSRNLLCGCTRAQSRLQAGLVSLCRYRFTSAGFAPITLRICAAPLN